MDATKLQDDLSAALLSAKKDGTAVWDALQDAKARLAEAVADANQTLKTNPLTPLVANQVAGPAAQIHVDSLGNVLISGKPKLSTGRRYQSTLPSITELRRQAEALGLDPEPFGRQKRKLVKAIEAARRVDARVFKTAPSVGTVTVIQPQKDAN